MTSRAPDETDRKERHLPCQFSYDNGRRVWIVDGQGNPMIHVYSELDIVYENSSSGATTRHFYAGGLRVAENRSGTVEYYHQDHLGSTRLRTDSTGGVVINTNYQPFGPGYGESGSEEFRYTGKREDSSGLHSRNCPKYRVALPSLHGCSAVAPLKREDSTKVCIDGSVSMAV